MLPVGMKAAVPALAAVGICCLWRKRREHGYVNASGRSLAVWFLSLFFFALAGAGRLWADMRLAQRCAAQLAELSGVMLRAEGTLADVGAGKEGSYAAVLTLSDVVLYAQGEAQAFEGELLVYLDEEPEREAALTAEPSDISGFHAGRTPVMSRPDFRAGRALVMSCPDWAEGRLSDRLRVSMRVSVWGEPESMGRATNPGQFDFGKYYHALGIEGRMFGEMLQAAGEEYSPYLDGIFRLKQWARRSFVRLCGTDSEDAGILTAVVLGDKTALASDVRELYQRNGIAHLLAVSGLHISLIGMGLYRLLRRRLGLGYEPAGVLAAVVTVTYGILTGGSASVVRAVVMVCLQILADKLGRTYDLLSAMALAAIMILAESPSLLFQAGFQLSFGAILAIGAVYPILAAWVDGGWKGEMVLLAIVIQIVTLPVTVYHFYEYPVYGTILNLLVIPLMGYVLVSGLAGLALGALWLPAGRFAIGTGHYILKLYAWLCRRFEELPGAVQIVGRPQLWQRVLYAAVWCAVLLWAARGCEKEKEMGRAGERGTKTKGKVEYAEERETKDKKRGRRSGLRLAALLVCACVGYLFLQALPVSGLRTTFLDMGQGDGICLESRKTVILVDGGSTSNKMLGEQVLEPYLKSRGISRVDYAVVSHGDEDHISGLRYLLETDCGITIGTLVLPWLAQDDGKYGELIQLAEAAGTAVVRMKAGDRICGRGTDGRSLQLACLYAGDPAYREDTNDHSLLIEAVFGKARFLLTGDISSEGERRWLRAASASQPEDVAASDRTAPVLSGPLRLTDRTAPVLSDPLHLTDRTALALSGPVCLLKAAHHGSSYSSSSEFLEYVDPDWVVISCGANNRYGHPGADTLERISACGAQAFLTMKSGALTVTTDGETMRLRAFLPGM